MRLQESLAGIEALGLNEPVLLLVSFPDSLTQARKF